MGEFAKASAAVLIDDRTGEVRLVAGAIERPPIPLPDAGAVLSGTLSAEEALRRALPDRPARTLVLHAVALREAIDIAAGRPHRGAA